MNGWETKTLGELCRKITDGVHLTPKYIESGIPFLSVKNLTQGIIDFSNTKFISLEDHKILIKRCKPEVQDILYTKVGTTGVAKIVDTEREFSLFVSVALLKPKHEVIFNRYLEHFLNSKLGRDQARKRTRGMANKNLVIKDIKEITISYPTDLFKQKQIVAIVDQAFEGIDRTIANTEKNLTNARELFESYLDAIFVQKGDEWVEKRLADIGGKVLTGPFGSLLHKSDYVSNGVPLVNPANIEGDRIIPDFNKTVDQDALNRLQAYILKENDIVVGRRGEIGRCSVVRKEQSGWLCGTGCFFIQPFKYTNPVFLAHLLRSTIYRNKLESLATGATMENLSNQSLSSLIIALPGLDEQNRIINKLNDLTIETRQLETIYQQKLAALNELKQSILQKAFTGELTADTTQQATEAAKEVVAA